MIPAGKGTAAQVQRYVDRASVSRIGAICPFGLALEPPSGCLHSFDEETEAGPQAATTLGPYVLIEEIGRGGGGVIYRARHRDTDQVIAVKTLRPEDADSFEAVERFRREALAAQSLDHPHAMPIQEIGCTEEGLPFFSMKLAVGGSLYYLQAKYSGRWRQIAELMVKISKAVHHAHERGILHRDLKPGNILFDENYEPLVTDFGLVKHLTGSSDLTQSCTVLGTPNYVAPEQAAGKTRELTAAADVYSLGAILFELLTGRPPFVGDNPLDVLRQVAEHSPSRPRRYVPSIPRALDTICMRCLQRRPKNRYSSAQEFANDLECWLEGRKLAARPIYARLTGLRAKVPVWRIALFGFAAVVFLTWTNSRRSRPIPEGTSSIAVAIDDLDQDAFLKPIVELANNELERNLAATDGFQLVGTRDVRSHFSDHLFDPLAYGRTVNARTVLTGSVRRSGNKVRFVVRLLRCDTGEMIWRYARALPAEDVTTALRAVVSTVTKTLSTKWHAGPDIFVLPTHRAPLPEAVTFCTKAIELAGHANRSDLEAAVVLFRRACTEDPHYATAQAMLAFALWTQANAFGELDKLPLAEAVARDAIAEDFDSAQAHRVIASCEFNAGRYEDALEEFWNAVELNPQAAGACQSLGICLREMGHPDQAISWFERAIQLSPTHGTLSGSLGETLILCGCDEDAEIVLKHAIDLDGDQQELKLVVSAMRVWQRRFEEARQLCVQARASDPDHRFGSSVAAWIELCSGKPEQSESMFTKLRLADAYQQSWECYGAINPSSALAYLAVRNGEPKRAQTLINEALRLDEELLKKLPNNPRILHDISATYAMTGNRDEAVSYLRKALAAGWIEHRSTSVDPRFELVAADPQFLELLRSTFPKTPKRAIASQSASKHFDFADRK